MIKRLIWWGSGAVMGAGGSLWAQYKLKKVVRTKVAAVQDTLRPSHIAAATKGRVVHAIDEGRDAALRRERELHGRLTAARGGRSGAAVGRGEQRSLPKSS